MKRSDVLSVIDNILIEDEYNKAGSFDLANKILNAIEKIGMVPPTVVFIATGDFENIHNLDILRDWDIAFEYLPDDNDDKSDFRFAKE